MFLARGIPSNRTTDFRRGTGYLLVAGGFTTHFSEVVLTSGGALGAIEAEAVQMATSSSQTACDSQQSQ